MDNMISLEDVSMSYGPRSLFEGVTFGLDDGDKVGLIGLNGSGKSSLLRIIAGRSQPDRGRAITASECVVAYLPQNPSFDPDQTVLDAVFTASDEAMRLLRDYELACRDLSLKSNDERILHESGRIPETTVPFSKPANKSRERLPGHLKLSRDPCFQLGQRPYRANCHIKSGASLKSWKGESSLAKQEKVSSSECWPRRRATSSRLRRFTQSFRRSIDSWRETLIDGRGSRSLLEKSPSSIDSDIESPGGPDFISWRPDELK